MSNEINYTEIVTDIAVMKEWKQSTEPRIQKLESDNKAMNRLTVIVEMQQKTMEAINETLTELKDSNKEISHEIKEIKEDVSTLTGKVEIIESADKVSIRGFFRKYGSLFIGTIIIGIAGYLLVKLGLK